MSKHERKKNKILPKHRLPRITNSSLEEKIKDSGLFPADKVGFIHDMKEKMSDVLMDFAQPILHGVEDDFKATEKALSFAVAVWNLSLLPKNEQGKGLNDIIEIISEKNDQEICNTGENIVKMLLDRKEKYFPNNKRFIINYEFGMKNGQPWVNVASTVE